jgi:hypothetical protein
MTHVPRQMNAVGGPNFQNKDSSDEKLVFGILRNGKHIILGNTHIRSHISNQITDTNVGYN